MYLVPQDTVDANKTNLLKEFMEECETVNFGKNVLTTNSVCPTDKLIIDNVEQQNIKAYKKALRTRLQEKAPELVGYVHDEEINTGYNIYANEENTSFYKLLDGYLKRTVSLHPLEWDFEKIRNDKVCETRGKAPVNEHACCDIFADLRKADEKTFKTNSFYFACAPYFYNKMEALGLLFRNPYEGKTYRELLNGVLDPIDGVNIDTAKVISNPGMTTLYDAKKDSGKAFVGYNGVKYSGVNGFFNAQYLPYHRGYTEYWHEGIDFRGKTGATIVSLVYGTVLRCGKRANNDEGFIIIQSKEDEQLFYLALHVDRTTIKVKDGEAVYPGMALGQTVFLPDSKGNDVSHLHVSVIKLPEGTDPVGNNGVIWEKNSFPIWGDSSTKDQEIWKNMINPFNYTDPIPWKGRY